MTFLPARAIGKEKLRVSASLRPYAHAATMKKMIANDASAVMLVAIYKTKNSLGKNKCIETATQLLIFLTRGYLQLL